MTDDELIAQFEAELAILNEVIPQIMRTGASYTIGSGSSSRTFTNHDLDKMMKQRSAILTQLKNLNGTGGLVVGAGY